MFTYELNLNLIKLRKLYPSEGMTIMLINILVKWNSLHNQIADVTFESPPIGWYACNGIGQIQLLQLGSSTDISITMEQKFNLFLIRVLEMKTKFNCTKYHQVFRPFGVGSVCHNFHKLILIIQKWYLFQWLIFCFWNADMRGRWTWSMASIMRKWY